MPASRAETRLMELRECIAVLRRGSRFFWLTVFAVVILAFAFVYSRPESYDSSLALNITRNGIQKTDQFRYDDFYRLQADEKFTETVVEWLKSPRVAKDIYDQSGIDTSSMSLRQLGRIVKPEKMSSQLVLVSFSAPDRQTAQKVSAAVLGVVNRNVSSLDREQQDEGWFQVIADDPVIVRHSVNPLALLFGSLAFGMFAAFWMVMIRHYLRD